MADQVLDYQLTLNSGGFVGGAGQASVALEGVGKVAKTSKESMRALGGAMELVGYHVAPQMTATLSTVTHVLKGVHAAAEGLGISLTTLGPIALAAVAGIVELTQAVALYKDVQKELASEKGLAEQQERIKKALSERITLLEKAGRLSLDEGQRLRNSFSQTSGLGSDPSSAQRALRRFSDEDRAAQQQLAVNQQIAELKPRTLTGAARAKAELQLELDKLAVDFKGTTEQFNTQFAPVLKNIFDTETARIDAAAAPKPTALRATPMTDLERIGFVFNRGGFSATDFNRETAQNTKLANSYLKQIAEKTTDNNFANQ